MLHQFACRIFHVKSEQGVGRGVTGLCQRRDSDIKIFFFQIKQNNRSNYELFDVTSFSLNSINIMLNKILHLR